MAVVDNLTDLREFRVRGFAEDYGIQRQKIQAGRTQQIHPKIGLLETVLESQDEGGCDCNRDQADRYPEPISKSIIVRCRTSALVRRSTVALRLPRRKPS